MEPTELAQQAQQTGRVDHLLLVQVAVVAVAAFILTTQSVMVELAVRPVMWRAAQEALLVAL